MMACATLPLADGRRLKAVEAKVGPRFVHIVEDNATFRKTLEGRLREFGYEVSTYPSAQHLLDRLPSDDVPSCLLLDVRLPGMSGPELQDRLIELGSTLPIIFLTGYSDIPTTVRIIKAGGQDFLIKPVSSEQLREAVGRAIAHHNAVLKVVLSRIATPLCDQTPTCCYPRSRCRGLLAPDGRRRDRHAGCAVSLSSRVVLQISEILSGRSTNMAERSLLRPARFAG